MNLVQIAERLKGVPKDFLMKEANPNSTSGRYPAYLIYAELKRRVSQEKMFANAEAADNPPQETVAERTMREATPTPTPMAAMQGLKSPRTTYQEEPSGQETMGIPGAVRMFEGGRVSFNDGGRLEEKLKEYKTLRDTGNKYTGATTKLRELEKEIIALGGQIPGMTGFAGAITRPFFQKTEAEQKRAQEQEQERQAIGEELAGIKTLASPANNFMALKPELVDANAVLTRQKELDRTKQKEEKKEERKVTEEQNTNLLTDQKTSTDNNIVKEESLDKIVNTSQQGKVGFDDFKKTAEQIQNNLKFELIPEDAVKFKHYEFADTYEQFTAARAQMRKNDFLGAMQGKIDELKSQNDKDRAQALDMFKLETGLAILSAPGQGKGFGGLLSTVAKALGTPLNQLKQTMQTIRQSEKDLTKSEMQLLQAYDARQEGNIRDFEARKEKAKDSEVAAVNAGVEATINITKDNVNIRNRNVEAVYTLAGNLMDINTKIDQANLDRASREKFKKLELKNQRDLMEIQTRYKTEADEKTIMAESIKLLEKQIGQLEELSVDKMNDPDLIRKLIARKNKEIARIKNRYGDKFGKISITDEPTTGNVKNYIDIGPAQNMFNAGSQ